MVLLSKPKLILLDIEGTTTSIAFVKECLFPYVTNNIKQYLTENWNEISLKEDIQLLRKQSEDDYKCGLTEVPLIVDNMSDSESVMNAVIDNVFWQMKSDRKTTALKQFQGNVWRFGYESGSISGHIYSEVPKAMNHWKSDLNIKICIYSSGSIFAQKLLFKYSVFGDLTPLIDNYFDTTIGPKVDSMSYSNIAKSLAMHPKDVLFLTDVVKEAIAAKNAGMSPLLLIREGNAPLTDQDLEQFLFVTSFADIEFQ